ncbi:MAG TPA: hypothetical protein VFZ23_03750 [Pyrinomonadaceae bacterium]
MLGLSFDLPERPVENYCYDGITLATECGEHNGYFARKAQAHKNPDRSPTLRPSIRNRRGIKECWLALHVAYPPFDAWKSTGRAIATIVGDRTVLRHGT